jgi:DNA segregation ATPase FtsK/SpoIIIE-like protein
MDKKHDATELVRRVGIASESLLQRRLRIIYRDAELLLNEMERDGIVSARDRSNRREVTIHDIR